MLEEEVPTSSALWPWLVWYLDVLVIHTAEIPPPAALVEGILLRWFILSCEYLISPKQISAHTCYQPHMGNESPKLPETRESLGNIGIFLLLKSNFPHMKFNFLQRLSTFFNGFLLSPTAFLFPSTAFHFPRNPKTSIYGEKYMKDHYLSFVFLPLAPQAS